MLNISSYEYLNRIEKRVTESKDDGATLAWTTVYLHAFDDLRNNEFFEMNDGRPLQAWIYGAPAEKKGELVRNFGGELVYVNGNDADNHTIQTLAAVYAARKGEMPISIPVEDDYALYVVSIAGFPNCVMLELLDHVERHNPTYCTDAVPAEQVYRIRLMQDMPEDSVQGFRASLDTIPLLCPWAKAELVTAHKPCAPELDETAPPGGDAAQSLNAQIQMMMLRQKLNSLGKCKFRERRNLQRQITVLQTEQIIRQFEQQNSIQTSPGYQGALYNHEPREQSGLKTAAKVFMILGTVFGGLILIPLAWCIPMTVTYFSKVRHHQPISRGFKFCCLLFVSIIGGILMLFDHDY